MKRSIRANTVSKKRKKPGPPRKTGKGLLIGMRWQAIDLDPIDAWARAHNVEERTDAIRQLVRLALAAEGKGR